MAESEENLTDDERRKTKAGAGVICEIGEIVLSAIHDDLPGGLFRQCSLKGRLAFQFQSESDRHNSYLMEIDFC
jgi:hypothetical protein